MFEVLMKSDMGDEWEWVGISTFDATMLWEILGQPQRVDLKGKPVSHGGIDAEQ